MRSIRVMTSVSIKAMGLSCTLLGSGRMGLVRFIAGLSSRFSRRFFPSPEPDDRSSQWLGRYGERLAVRYLQRQRYRVLYQNFRAPGGGEVDMVCRDKAANTLVFVEVKTRRTLEFGAPAEAVTRSKQTLIAKGGLAWLQLLNNPEILFRFDILEIVVTDGEPHFNLIRNAFALPEPYIY